MDAADLPQSAAPARDYTTELRIRLPNHLADELGRAAMALDLSRAALVRLVLRKYLRHEDE